MQYTHVSSGLGSRRSNPALHSLRAWRIGAHGHVTFGGRLPADAKGFPASAMAKTHAGDWRDPERIRGWAAEVAMELLSLDQPGRLHA